LRTAETVGGGWWGGKADVAESVYVVYGVVGGSTVGCIGEAEKWKEAEVS